MNSNRALGFACDRIRLGTPINDSQAVAAVSAGSTTWPRWDEFHCRSIGRLSGPKEEARVPPNQRCDNEIKGRWRMRWKAAEPRQIVYPVRPSRTRDEMVEV